MDEPLFDSTRAALRFALNHHLAAPRPLMSRMADRTTVRQVELADGSKIQVAVKVGRRRNPMLRGLDGAAQAGMICARLAALPEPQQLVLMAEVLPPANPCSCRSPCCRGDRPNQAWARAITLLCAHLRDHAQLSRVKGKKGLSTAPELRRALVEKFFVPSREVSLAAIAARFGVTENTLIAHRKPILLWLSRTRDEAWRGIDELLGEGATVGTLT